MGPASGSGHVGTESGLRGLRGLRGEGDGQTMPEAVLGVVEGTVRWFNPDRGYGFLRVDGGDEDVFVHHRDILGSGWRVLRPGGRVRFCLVRRAKGPLAREVYALDAGGAAAAQPGRDAAGKEPSTETRAARPSSSRSAPANAGESSPASNSRWKW